MLSKYRTALPQLRGDVYLTDGGLETTLIFHEGVDLPDFAAFTLLESEKGRGILRTYYQRYLAVAERYGAGFILEAPTWRASPDWATRQGLNTADLESINREAIVLLAALRDEAEAAGPVILSGCVGPRGDGYAVGQAMSAEQAREYHAVQIGAWAESAADMVCAMTMTSAEEATGVVEAAREVSIPVAISFTTETDGRLPAGQGLGDAIAQVDEATANFASYYMVNCAHPTHFSAVLKGGGQAAGGGWRERIRGVRANASMMSHAELDEAETLDAGDPARLAGEYVKLRELLPNLNVLGGCCGTDHRHIEAMAHAWTFEV